MSKKPISGLRMALIVSLLSTPIMAAEPLDPGAVNAQTEADTAAQAAQTAINDTVERTQVLGGEYAQTMAEVDSLNKYNEQLQSQINSQEAEMASIGTQLTDIETTNREVLPLMERMLATLEQFVAADLPFMKEERMGLVNRLKDLMPRADVAISEKYRRILEAYQIELDYGRTAETYEGQMDDGRTVQFVKLGRVSLMYQTLDGTETGYWDAQASQWVVDNSYADNVRDALGVVRGDGAPDLLRVPVPAPQEAQQ
jgi:vacuolar-type H+-ATPase subunit I/STV1